MLDPLYVVRKPFAETCYQTKDVEVYENVLEMQIELEPEDVKHPVEIRGLYPGVKGLNWPMQGSFYLNEETRPFHELRPLLESTNRKHRKEDYIAVPKDKLNIGKNKVYFKVPKLNLKYKENYKIHKTGDYFFGVYSIQKIHKEVFLSKLIQ